jgi:NAD(P)-dependent dehydrogenase (short-subunit alcohol dehydrogenase family)
VSSVLITGAGRGIGRATALRLARAGWTVYATVRRAADGEELVAAAAGGEVRPLQVDVTSDAQIAASRPRARYPVGVDVRVQAALSGVTPDRVKDAAFGRLTGTPARKR